MITHAINDLLFHMSAPMAACSMVPSNKHAPLRRTTGKEQMLAELS
jgi:hypothetical protein